MNYINKLKHLKNEAATTASAHKPSHAQWLKAWRELATLTLEITQNAPQFQPILQALDRCDNAYLAGDWVAFQRAGLSLRQLVGKKEA